MRSPFARFWPRGQNSKSLKIQSGSPDQVEDILDHRIRDIRNLDPETERRWQFLAWELEQQRLSPEVPRRNRWVRPLRISVPIAALAGAAVVAVIFWPRSMVPETFQTLRGQQTTITLPDSSQVVLNHTSSLTLVDRTFATSREVTLRGEGLFRVRKIGTPFVVRNRSCPRPGSRNGV